MEAYNDNLDNDLYANPFPDKKERFKLFSADEFSQRPLPTWIIKGIVPQAELGAIYGEPGSGKTFAALDQAMAIARGLPWNGHKTKIGRVVYLAAEAQGSFSMRLRSYQKHHGVVLSDLDFQVIEDAPSFIKPGDALEIAQRITAYNTNPVSVIYVDTLARVTAGGDESGSEDMGMMLMQVKLLHDLTGAMIMLVHHCGKDITKGGRGWSGILGALDVEIFVENKDNPRLLTITKQKEGSKAKPMSFEVIPIDLEEDKDGEMVTSCAIEFVEVLQAAIQTSKDKPMGDVEKIVWKIYQEIKHATGESLVNQAELIDRSIRKITQNPQARDKRSYRVCRAIESLCADEKLAISGEFVFKP